MKIEIKGWREKKGRFTPQEGYSAGLDGTLNFVAARAAEVADTIADDTADPKVMFS